MSYGIFSLLSYGLKSILLPIALIFVMQQAFFKLILICLNVRSILSKAQFGFYFGKSIFWIHLIYNGYSIKIREVLILSLFRKFEIRDVDVECKIAGKIPKELPEEHSLNLEIPLSVGRLKLLSKVLPLDLRLVNFSLRSGDTVISSELALLKFEYDVNATQLRAVILFYGVKLSDNVNLSQVKVSSQSYLVHKSSDKVYFDRWSCGLNIGGLEYRTSDDNKNKSKNNYSNSVPINSALYEKVLKKLETFTVHLENVNITLPNKRSCFVSSASLNLNPSKEYNLFTHSIENHNITIALNSLVYTFSLDQDIKIPAMNILLNCDIMTFLKEELDYQSFSGLCTVNIIDPKISIMIDRIKDIKEHYPSSSSFSSSRSLMDRLGSLKFPPIIVKLLISNSKVTLKQNSDTYYELVADNVNSELNLTSLFSGVNDSFSADMRKLPVNTLKLESVSVKYMLDAQSSSSMRHLMGFDKWVLTCDRYGISPNKIFGVLHTVRINVDELRLLDGLLSIIAIMTTKEEKKVEKHYVAKQFQFFAYELDLHIKEISITVSAIDYFPAHLHNLHDNEKVLRDGKYSIGLHCKNTKLEYSNVLKRIEFNSLNVTKQSEISNNIDSSEMLLFDNLTLDISDSLIKIDIPQLKYEFDVNSIWFWFYFKHSIIKRIKPKLRQERKALKHTKLMDLNISKILAVFNLPQNMTLLMVLNDTAYTTTSSEFSIADVNLLVESVYTNDHTVHVPLLKMASIRASFSSTTGLDIVSDYMTLKMEYHFRFYTIVDRLSTTIKVYKLLRAAFQTPETFNILYPKADPPVRLPNIKIQTKTLSIMANEDLFEQELGLIYKVGVLEQRERLEKMTIFLNSERVNNSSELREDQYRRLYEHFSTSWIVRYRVAKRKFHGAKAFAIKSSILGYEFSTFSVDNDVNTFKLSIEDVDLKLSQPSFPLGEYGAFLHKHGKGVPFNTEYTINIPMGIDLKTGSFQILLRDYPLPALFFPNTLVSGDIVFTEAMASSKSWRKIYVPFNNILPEGSEKHDTIFGSHVIRTLTPIKTFMDIKFRIDSDSPTVITWGKSLQPGYQSVMLWFDFLTKPPLDPSPKLGFWDKFRLLVHGVLAFEWIANSSVHLNIKGSSDPYSIADVGAGLTFAWKGNARLLVNGSEEPDSFLQIKSNEFQMGIRDFFSSTKFDKVIMKLFGKVEWKMGLLFESGDSKMVGYEPRSKYLKPHYQVELVHPDQIVDITKHDSYKGFRTDFIHMSFGVYSDKSSVAKNTVHLAPESLSHFLAWWRLFSTYTSGPIRQGSLFPDLLQNGKKFGKSLFTVKYQLSLAPIEITHVHRHADSQMNLKQNNNIAFTGIKANIESLKLDLHQKRIKAVAQNDILQISRPVWRFCMSLAELDFVEADIRVLFAVFDQEAVEELLAKTLGLSADSDDVLGTKKDEGYGFTNSSWFDKEDYIDLHQVQLISQTPIKFSAIPFIYSPRITYFRNLAEQGLKLKFPFGDEDMHSCYLGQIHPEITQKHLVQGREIQLRQQISNLQAQLDALIGDRASLNSLNNELSKKKDELQSSLHFLKHSLHLIHEMLKDLEISENAQMQDPNTDCESSIADSDLGLTFSNKDKSDLLRMNTIDSFIKLKHFGDINNESSFDNRFIFHNVLIKIDKSIRDHLLDYITSIAIRTQYQFFITHKAMMIFDELLKNRFRKSFIAEPQLSQDSCSSSLSNKELLEMFEDFIREVSDGFEAFDNYSIRLLSPQLQITSDVEPEKAIVVVSRDVEISIIDVHTTLEIKAEHLGVNTLMETRYCFNIADSQFFILDRLETSEWPQMMAHSNTYGVEDSKHSWPPWLPLEVCYSTEFLGRHLFLNGNDMFITFIRPNSLFFDKQTSTMSGRESRFHVGFPRLYLTSTSEQYSAIFNIVEDMLSFVSDKNKKVDKLAQVFLADEIKLNLGKLDTTVVENLQKKIRALKYLDSFTRFNDPITYSKCSQDILVEFQTAKLQLNLLMSAIKRNYDRLHFQNKSQKNNRLSWWISADELMWELFDENKESFVVFGLGASHFVRTETYYGSTSNKISISTLQCYNIQPKTVYKELLGPFEKHSKFDPSKPFLEITWNMGMPVGGISNLLDLDFTSQPIIFKMDFRTSEKLMSYLFPKVKEQRGGKNVVLKQSFEMSDTKSRELSRRPSLTSISTSNTVMTPVTRRMILSDWDVQGFTKVLERNGENNYTKHVYDPDKEMDEMVKRSSKYFNVGKITVNPLVMSVSYKGSKSVITNVDNLIVKVPTIQYKNKIWSSEDFIVSFKKDIIKIVLQHAGTIIGNKFVPHKNENRYEPLKQISNLLKPDLQKIQKSTASLPTLAKLSSKNTTRSSVPTNPSTVNSNSVTENSKSIKTRSEDQDTNNPVETYDVEEFYPDNSQ